MALQTNTGNVGCPVRLLVPGDRISADGDVGMMCTELKVPALTGGCKRCGGNRSERVQDPLRKVLSRGAYHLLFNVNAS